MTTSFLCYIESLEAKASELEASLSIEAPEYNNHFFDDICYRVNMLINRTESIEEAAANND
jgi:hypothetical protein